MSPRLQKRYIRLLVVNFVTQGNMVFRDRADAGKQLAEALQKYKNAPLTIVIALPRGGVTVGYEVAQALNLPLDIVTPRKIGSEHDPEYAIGAITEIGESVWNEAEKARASKDYLRLTIEREKKEAIRRLRIYRGNRPPRDLKNKTVILVDDGVAMGLTMRAAIRTVAAEKSRAIIVAVPVGPPDTIKNLKKEADKVICLQSPFWFGAVGQFYEKFPQTSDQEVVDLLKKTSA